MKLIVILTPCGIQVNEVVRRSSRYEGTVWIMLVVLTTLNCDARECRVTPDGTRFTNMSMTRGESTMEQFEQICLDTGECPLIEIEILFCCYIITDGSDYITISLRSDALPVVIISTVLPHPG